MFLPLALKAINHLLSGEDWALQRLRPFAGQTLRIRLGGLELPLQIDASGSLCEQMKGDSPAGEPPVVTITLPADAPARLILDRASLIGSAQISGSAELAECLSFIFKNLRWDPEHDLAQVVGDIAARRMADGGRRFVGWQADQLRNLAGNLADFFTTEQPTLIQRDDAARFASAVAQTQDSVERLEIRISKLERPDS
jgi:ubiquinone biosynthesis protein UbiJ